MDKDLRNLIIGLSSLFAVSLVAAGTVQYAMADKHKKERMENMTHNKNGITGISPTTQDAAHYLGRTPSRRYNA